MPATVAAAAAALAVMGLGKDHEAVFEIELVGVQHVPFDVRDRDRDAADTPMGRREERS